MITVAGVACFVVASLGIAGSGCVSASSRAGATGGPVDDAALGDATVLRDSGVAIDASRDAAGSSRDGSSTDVRDGDSACTCGCFAAGGAVPDGGRSTLARAADSFVESIGINAHLNWAGDVSDNEVAVARLRDSNIRYYRVGAAYGPGNFGNYQAPWTTFNELADAGVHANVLWDYAVQPGDNPSAWNPRPDDFASGVHGIASFEGPNEKNCQNLETIGQGEGADGGSRYCVEVSPDAAVGVAACEFANTGQQWEYEGSPSEGTLVEQISGECLGVSSSAVPSSVELRPCDGNAPPNWAFSGSGPIKTSGGACLTAVGPNNLQLEVERCVSPTPSSQNWTMTQVPWSANAANDRDYMIALAAFAHAKASTQNIPILAPSMCNLHGLAQMVVDSKTLGPFSASVVQVGNMHAYPDGVARPEVGSLVDAQAPSGNGPSFMGAARENVPNGLLEITETGYGSDKVSRETQAKFDLRLLLNAWNHGVARTYLFELIDDKYDGSYFNRFGILDGRDAGFPTYNPKPAYYAIQGLIATLTDRCPGFTPASLAFSFGSDGSTLEWTLLQKSSGDFYLIAWLAEDEPADGGTSPSRLTELTLPSATLVSAQTFDAEGMLTPVPVGASADEWSFKVTGMPTILLIH